MAGNKNPYKFDDIYKTSGTTVNLSWALAKNDESLDEWVVQSVDAEAFLGSEDITDDFINGYPDPEDNIALVQITGGEHGNRILLKVDVTMTTGEVIELQGYVRVDDFLAA